MKLSRSEQEALVSLLTRIHFDILAVENAFNLLVGEGDFRARIEYFHDAVRAVAAGDSRDDNHRLSVEWLAYDLECLRYIHAMPLSPFKPHGGHHSPATDLIKVKPNALSPKPGRMDRETRARLVDLYRHYAVIFAALLKPSADADYHERADAMNQDVESIHTLLDQFDHGTLDQALATAQHIEDPVLRQELMDFLHREKLKKSAKLQALVAEMKKTARRKDEEIRAVEKAHLQYGVSQLAIYENAKDLVKKMAGAGMNLAGRFVESAMAETQREIGRG